MNLILSELKLIFRSRLSLVTLVFLFCISTLSIGLGIKELHKQQHTIESLEPLHEQDVALLAERFKKEKNGGEAGDAAYYTFFYTWDAPPAEAFAALGLRDVAPYVLRIRALGLQAQLYEGESFNPELTLPGRFDFAFVLIYLSPLFIIALLHDLISSEKQSGRLRLLGSLPRFGARSWTLKAALRYLLVFFALVTPLIIGAIYLSVSLSTLLGFIAITLLYMAFWFGLSLWIISRGWHSVTNATTLVSLWVMLTLILPTLSNLVITRKVPVAQGVDLMLTQRQTIHSAWEIPREITMQQFFIHHPEWKDTAPLPPTFHWKWYFAFHQLGDESVERDFQAYRQGLLKRQQWTNRLGWFLPGVSAQTTLHRFANTDLLSQLDYQDQIIKYHQSIRNFYYHYLFNETPFYYADFQKRPEFQPEPKASTVSVSELLPLTLLSIIFLILGIYGLSRPQLK
ncbi:ABC transporter permease [Acinetobacter stercoris]|uniref:ABC-2 family transporter protein n=1 Tax=Acinetobacter stercoris TaxID=2126983 RepID=A0A2U3MXB7_9GAMM|nr:DUF3526 domain-containing protein [Acinetobacter stercoris]SPL70025.1 ABC-2 family transporter protein [Acinetobacter stercoris]